MCSSLLQSGDKKPLALPDAVFNAVFNYCQNGKMAISMIPVAALIGGGFFFVRPRETLDLRKAAQTKSRGPINGENPHS
jgi:hypothetical protein